MWLSKQIHSRDTVYCLFQIVFIILEDSTVDYYFQVNVFPKKS